MYTMHTSLTPFHLAFQVHDLEAARHFYGTVLGLPQGRSSDTWIDFDLFGHQIVTHLRPDLTPDTHHNPVDGQDVPVPHFGVVLEWEAFQGFARKLTESGIRFVIEPYIRFQGQPGEQATMFFLDPSGNALEFKSFRDPAKLFATT